MITFPKDFNLKNKKTFKNIASKNPLLVEDINKEIEKNNAINKIKKKRKYELGIIKFFINSGFTNTTIKDHKIQNKMDNKIEGK